MNRIQYSILGVIAVVVLCLCAWLVWSLLPRVEPSTQAPGTSALPDSSGTYIPYPSTAPGLSAGTPDEQAAKAAYEAALSADNPDNIRTQQTVAKSGYALQLWVGDNTGGEALLKFDSGKNAWVILDPGGGEWSLQGLMSMGVPQETAQALLAGVPR